MSPWADRRRMNTIGTRDPVAYARFIRYAKVTGSTLGAAVEPIRGAASATAANTYGRAQSPPYQPAPEHYAW
jgi:hypothetical protein